MAENTHNSPAPHGLGLRFGDMGRLVTPGGHLFLLVGHWGSGEHCVSFRVDLEGLLRRGFESSCGGLRRFRRGVVDCHRSRHSRQRAHKQLFWFDLIDTLNAMGDVTHDPQVAMR